MERIELLKRVPLLKDLSEEDLGKIAAVSHEERVEDGAHIVEIGDPGDSLYLLVEGAAQVLYPGRSADFELASLAPGDFFGEMALLNDRPRSATVRALEPARLLVVSKEDFQKVMLEAPAVAVKLLEMMSYRIRNADEQISGLSEKVTRDALTGLLNRRAFNERLQEEIDRSTRYGDRFALILLDIDHFKTVNDTFGHDVGDRVLSWVGRLMEDHTRSADVPFRVGGEEFAVIAPGTDTDTASIVAGRLVELVAEARPPVEIEITLTVSGGYAACPAHGRQTHLLYHAADQALLRAKAEGRNRIESPPVD